MFFRERVSQEFHVTGYRGKLHGLGLNDVDRVVHIHQVGCVAIEVTELVSCRKEDGQVLRILLFDRFPLFTNQQSGQKPDVHRGSQLVQHPTGTSLK